MADGATCPFSGTMMVDVTSSTMFPKGTITAEGITFPGLPTFDICCTFNGPFGGEVWRADSSNHPGQTLELDFTTGHTPASLVSFDGGSITGDSAFGPVFPEFFYVDFSGSITPVPEPSSLALLGGGVLVFTQVRRKLR